MAISCGRPSSGGTGFAGRDLSSGLFPRSTVCGKGFEGVLVHSNDVAPPRTHSIPDLLTRVPLQWFTDLREPLAEIMDQFYFPTRYPDALPGSFPEGLPGKEDAEEAGLLARQVMLELPKPPA